MTTRDFGHILGQYILFIWGEGSVSFEAITLTSSASDAGKHNFIPGNWYTFCCCSQVLFAQAEVVSHTFHSHVLSWPKTQLITFITRNLLLRHVLFLMLPSWVLDASKLSDHLWTYNFVSFLFVFVPMSKFFSLWFQSSFFCFLISFPFLGSNPWYTIISSRPRNESATDKVCFTIWNMT